MARPKGQGNLTKMKIAEKARMLFVKKGYSATSMEDIRLEAGVSKGLAYYHFKNKEEMYLFCLKTDTQKLISEWESDMRQSNKTAAEMLYSLAHYFISEEQAALTKSIPEFIEVTNPENKTDKTISELIEQVINPEIEIVSKVIKEGVTRGEFKRSLATEDLATILYCCLTSFSFITFLGYSEEVVLNLYKQFVDTTLQGLLNQPH